jgi:Bacterial Ig-like domain (group 2).
MKRLLILFGIFANIGFLCAQELNPDQSKLRNDIKSFLQQEGFVPSIDSDGDIAFKSEGNSFWISVSAEDDVPMYTSLNIGFNKPAEYLLNAMKLAAAEMNYYKGVKVLCFEDGFTFRAELYVMNAEQFKYSFYAMLSQVKAAAGDFVETYEKYATTSSKNNSSQYSSRTQSSNSSSSSYSSSSSLRTVTSKNVSLKVSEQVQLKVTGQNVKLWESDNERIASVSSTGVVTGVAPGTTNIWAHYGSGLKLFNITVTASSYSSSSGSTSYSSSSSTSGASRTIYSKEATIKVGERVTAQLPEGKIDRWEMNSTNLQYLSPTSNNTITATRSGEVIVWGYIGNSPKLFRLKIVGAGTYVPQDRAPYLVTSKEFTMYVGDQITAELSDGTITRWEIELRSKDCVSAEGNVLQAKKAGYITVWGYIDKSPKLFKITIKAR